MNATITTTSRVLPIRLTSKIIPGFGRGSKDLGIPTANISRDDLNCEIEFDALPCGIYWGFARVTAAASTTTATVSAVAATGSPTITPTPTPTTPDDSNTTTT